jgi:plasmid stability protein
MHSAIRIEAGRHGRRVECEARFLRVGHDQVRQETLRLRSLDAIEIGQCQAHRVGAVGKGSGAEDGAAPEQWRRPFAQWRGAELALPMRAQADAGRPGRIAAPDRGVGDGELQDAIEMQLLELEIAAELLLEAQVEFSTLPEQVASRSGAAGRGESQPRDIVVV